VKISLSCSCLLAWVGYHVFMLCTLFAHLLPSAPAGQPPSPQSPDISMSCGSRTSEPSAGNWTLRYKSSRSRSMTSPKRFLANREEIPHDQGGTSHEERSVSTIGCTVTRCALRSVVTQLLSLPDLGSKALPFSSAGQTCYFVAVWYAPGMPCCSYRAAARLAVPERVSQGFATGER